MNVTNMLNFAFFFKDTWKKKAVWIEKTRIVFWAVFAFVAGTACNLFSYEIFLPDGSVLYR